MQLHCFLCYLCKIGCVIRDNADDLFTSLGDPDQILTFHQHLPNGLVVVCLRKPCAGYGITLPLKSGLVYDMCGHTHEAPIKETKWLETPCKNG